jgi:SnoaL-like domain
MCGELTALLDHREIMDRISDLALGLDLREFDRYRRCFADQVEIRNPHFSPGGAPVRTCAGDEWARSVYRTQARLGYCLHTLTSPAVDLDGDRAEATVIQQAYFALDAAGQDQRGYRVGGPLRLLFLRTGHGWRIRRLEFTVTWSEGNPAVYEQARREAAAVADTAS